MRNPLVSLFTCRRHRGDRRIASTSPAPVARMSVRSGKIGPFGSSVTSRRTASRHAGYTIPVYSPYRRASAGAARTSLFRVF